MPRMPCRKHLLNASKAEKKFIGNAARLLHHVEAKNEKKSESGSAVSDSKTCGIAVAWPSEILAKEGSLAAQRAFCQTRDARKISLTCS